MESYGLFLAKGMTYVVLASALLIVFFTLLSRSRKAKGGQGRLKLEALSRILHERYMTMLSALSDSVALKTAKKQWQKRNKQLKKARKQGEAKRIYVLDFEGDIQASQVTKLREEVSSILMVATPQDEVVVRLSSAGGLVNNYGLAASQLVRLREAGIPLTVAIDKVAASGGYLMSVVANKIIAAPFAIVGSIGVVVQLPNFHRWLKQRGVDVEQHTAGKYKRTLTMLGENTEEGREKIQEEIAEVHDLFKQFIQEYRPQCDVEKVATGEYWHGKHAYDLALVDVIQTSDDYLYQALTSNTVEVFQLTYQPSKSKRSSLFSIVKSSLLRGMSSV